MDLHYKQEVAVGVIVLMGIAAFVGGTMWLRGRSFSGGGGQVLVQFQDVGNLKRGSPVKVSGVSLGSVEKIEFRDVGNVVATLSLDRKITPKIDATASMVAVGLVGDVSILFDPGTSAERLPPDRVIQGTVERGLTEIGTELGTQAQEVMANVQEIVSRRTADDLHATLVAMQRMMNTFADTQKGPTAEMTRTMTSIRRLGDRLDSTLASPAFRGTVENLDSVTASMSEMTAQLTTTSARLDTLLAGINRGQGTLGKLATDSTLYHDMQELSRSLKGLVDELTRHPGKLTVQVKLF